jgi:hypothetical protein
MKHLTILGIVITMSCIAFAQSHFQNNLPRYKGVETALLLNTMFDHENNITFKDTTAMYIFNSKGLNTKKIFKDQNLNDWCSEVHYNYNKKKQLIGELRIKGTVSDGAGENYWCDTSRLYQRIAYTYQDNLLTRLNYFNYFSSHREYLSQIKHLKYDISSRIIEEVIFVSRGETGIDNNGKIWYEKVDTLRKECKETNDSLTCYYFHNKDLTAKEAIYFTDDNGSFTLVTMDLEGKIFKTDTTYYNAHKQVIKQYKYVEVYNKYPGTDGMSSPLTCYYYYDDKNRIRRIEFAREQQLRYVDEFIYD